MSALAGAYRHPDFVLALHVSGQLSATTARADEARQRAGAGVVVVDTRSLSVGYVAPTWPTGSVPKREHIDLDVDDLEGAERRALSLGAVRAQSQPDPESYVVLLDPAGHPFCLTTQTPGEWLPTDRPERDGGR